MAAIRGTLQFWAAAAISWSSCSRLVVTPWMSCRENSTSDGVRSHCENSSFSSAAMAST